MARRSPRLLMTALLAVGLLATACGGDGAKAAPPASTSGERVELDDIDLSGITLRVGSVGNRWKTAWEFAAPATPYDVEFTEFQAAPPIIEALNGDAIDVAIGGDTGVIFAHANGVDVRVVGAGRGNGEVWRLLVPADSDIETVADLRGKEVAVFHGSAGHGFLLDQLDRAGVPADEVEQVNLTPPDAGGAFQRGEVDAWATWEPFAATAEQDWGAKLVTDGKGTWDHLQLYLVTPDLLEDEKRSAAVAHFLATFSDVYATEVVERDGWIAALSEANDIPLAKGEPYALRNSYVNIPLDDEVVESYRSAAQIYFDAGLIPEVPDPTEFIDYRFADQLAEAVEAADARIAAAS